MKHINSSVRRLAETQISNATGAKVAMSNHFLERLFERFGGKFTLSAVNAIKNALTVLRIQGSEEAVGVALMANGKRVTVPVVVTSNGTVLLKTIY